MVVSFPCFRLGGFVRHFAPILHSSSRFPCPIIPVIPLGNEILCPPSPGPIPCGWTPAGHGPWSQWAGSRRPGQPAGSSHCKPAESDRLKIPTSPAGERQGMQNSTSAWKYMGGATGILIVVLGKKFNLKFLERREIL